MSRFTRLLARLPFFLLVSVLLFLFYKNYRPHTFLAGWDNLMPELNLGMNIKRSLLAVWQEYQGLGLVGGMGHATDLIRQLMLLPFTLILPTNLIRYLWHFSMIALGTLSMYFGLKKVLKFSSWIALAASLFYLLNFGSVQNFWPPFEPFSTFWGFFPLLIFSLLSYLQKPSKSLTFQLIAFNFLAIPAFYVQTIFLVYLLCVSLILFSYLLSNKLSFLHSLKIIMLILFLNAFWLFPFVYFLKTEAFNPRQSIGNLMATEETVERNLYRGHLSDFLLLRGYYYDIVDNGANFMAPWRLQFANNFVLISGYLLASVALLGLLSLLSTFKKHRPLALSFIGLFLLVAIALLSDTPPFSFINHLFRSISFIDQAFRSPFTKFITPAAFIFSVLTAYGLDFIRQHTPRFILFFVFAFYFSLLTFYSFPIFQGHYIYNEMHQSIPDDYLKLIQFFQNKSPTARIANLPQGDYWGWTSYRWGLRGSGFLWYGIQQPILDRAFDVWNLNNENYYWELTYILQKNDHQLFLDLLQKYSIQYAYYDDAAYFPGQLVFDKIALNTKELLQRSRELTPIAHFGSITVYQTPFATAPYLAPSQESFPPLLPSITTYRHPAAQPLQSLSVLPLTPANFEPTTFSDSYGYHLYGYSFPTAKLDQNYYLHVSSQHFSGYPLIIGIYDNNNHFRYTTTRLDLGSPSDDQWFFIPAMESGDFSNGISVVFNNASFTTDLTKNRLNKLELYATPWPTAYFNVPSSTPVPLSFNSAISFYRVDLPAFSASQSIVLPQSYEKGWLALYFTGSTPHLLSSHYQAYGWASAWELSTLPSSVTHLYFLFWPQLLEFVGFLLLPLPLFLLRRSSQ